MVSVRKQLAPSGGVQAFEQPDRTGQQIGQSNILGGGGQPYSLAIHLPLPVDVFFLQLRRCESTKIHTS